MHATYRGIALLSDSASLRHFPSLRASSSFCCLPASKPLSPYRSLLSAFPPLSTCQTLPLFALHFNLILHKTQIDAEKGSARLPPPAFCVILPVSLFSFSLLRLRYRGQDSSQFHIYRFVLRSKTSHPYVGIACRFPGSFRPSAAEVPSC